MKAPESLPEIPFTTAASQVATKSRYVRASPRGFLFFLSMFKQRPKVPQMSQGIFLTFIMPIGFEKLIGLPKRLSGCMMGLNIQGCKRQSTRFLKNPSLGRAYLSARNVVSEFLTGFLTLYLSPLRKLESGRRLRGMQRFQVHQLEGWSNYPRLVVE